MALRSFLLVIHLFAVVVAFGQSPVATDTVAGYVLFAFRGGGCGLSEHDAPTGYYQNVDIREFYRWNVTCVSTSGGYASSGWPANGRSDGSKYLAFQIIPLPGYEVRLTAGGLGFQARRDVSGPDSVEVILQTAYRPLRSIMRAGVNGQLRTITGMNEAIVLGGPTLVRIHAWRSDSIAGGVAAGGLFIDDVTLTFRVYPLSATGVAYEGSDVARSISLSAYPNPFNPETSVQFRLEREERVRLSVYDGLGRPIEELLDRALEPGDHAVRWNASRCPSGTYFVRLESASGVVTRKVLLLR